LRKKSEIKNPENPRKKSEGSAPVFPKASRFDLSNSAFVFGFFPAIRNENAKDAVEISIPAW